MIDWSRAYSAGWRVFRVSADTWADDGLVSGVDSVEVRRNGTGAAPLVDSGEMDVTGARPAEGYYRVVLSARQDGVTTRADVCTMLFVTTGGEVSHGVDRPHMVGRSVLWPAHTSFLPDGAYAPKGADGAAYVADMLGGCLAAPVSVDGTDFRLGDNVVFQLGSRALEAAWLVLRAGGWTMQVHGDGSVHLLPLPTEPALAIDASMARMVEDGTRYEADWSDVPNRYTAVSGRERATVTNDDPASEVSTVARGYVFETRDGSPVPLDGESLEAYARRRLREESTISCPYTYVRRWSPDVRTDDIVRATLPRAGLDGDLRVQAQTIRCGRGVDLTECAAREVALWS